MDAEVIRFDGGDDIKRNFKDVVERELTFNPDACVLCLIDLYQATYGVYDKKRMTPGEGFIQLRTLMVAQIRSEFHDRLGVFPVVMEVETWLLADPELKLPSEPAPEAIAHPKAYLQQHYASQNKTYGETTKGVNLFHKASAKRVYEDNCPHFVKLVAWLIAPSPVRQSPNDEQIQQKQAAWEAKRDQLYNDFLLAEQNINTDADLRDAIEKEHAFDKHIQTYQQIFE